MKNIKNKKINMSAKHSRYSKYEHFKRECKKKMTNTFWKFIQIYLKYPWDWYWGSSNPNITWDIIKNNLDKPWSWRYVSKNPNITWDNIQENLDKPWDWKWISYNSNITWDIIEANPDKPWSWYFLSKNPSEIDIQSILLISLCSIIITSLVSIYPALKASNLDPVKGLKYE